MSFGEAVPVRDEKADEVTNAVKAAVADYGARASKHLKRYGGTELLLKLGLEHGISSPVFSLAAIGMAYLGTRYSMGAKNPEKGSTDCSGFVYFVCAKYAGITPGEERLFAESTKFHDMSRNYGNLLRSNEVPKIKAGSLIAKPDSFGTEGHVAIVLANDPATRTITFIDASTSTKSVRIKIGSYQNFNEHWFTGKNSTLGVVPPEKLKDFALAFRSKYGTKVASAEPIKQNI